MAKYKALKDFPSGSLNRMVYEGEEVELDYTYDEIKQHFGDDFVEPLVVKRKSKASPKKSEEKLEGE